MSEIVFMTQLVLVFVMILLINAKKERPLAFFTTAVLVLSFIPTTFYFYDTLKGYPVVRNSIDTEVQVLYTINSDEAVYVWIYDEERRLPKAVAIPPTEENKKQGQKVNTDIGDGVIVKIRPGEESDSYEFFRVKPGDVIKK